MKGDEAEPDIPRLRDHIRRKPALERGVPQWPRSDATQMDEVQRHEDEGRDRLDQDETAPLGSA